MTAAPATLELGEIDGPLLLFGGSYGNLEATRELVAVAERLAIPPSRCLCTGDTVAYAADPAATAALVRDWGAVTIQGNCEESLALGRDECGCGFVEGSACDRLARAWWRHVEHEVGADLRRWMAALPRRLRFRVHGVETLVVHGGVRDIARHVFASTSDVVAEELAAAGADLVIAGHCGLPFTRRIGDRLWYNPGAIGLPANDGTPDGWYALLHPGRRAGEIDLVHYRLAYDHRTAAGKMRRHGLPDGYADALASGLWPSLEVLPAAERTATGRPLAYDGRRTTFAPRRTAR